MASWRFPGTKTLREAGNPPVVTAGSAPFAVKELDDSGAESGMAASVAPV
jgi:hypothetical protein